MSLLLCVYRALALPYAPSQASAHAVMRLAALVGQGKKDRRNRCVFCDELVEEMGALPNCVALTWTACAAMTERFMMVDTFFIVWPSCRNTNRHGCCASWIVSSRSFQGPSTTYAQYKYGI